MEHPTMTAQLIEQKLTVFTDLQTEFEASFHFLQNVHGQRRFSTLAVADCVRYLHARWICECKSLLLSVSKTVKEYEGARCLELLRLWQEERDTASVVAFLYEKLDMLPIAEITRQVQEARHVRQNETLAQRLEHGRTIMLNRGINLMHALDAIFSLSEPELLMAVEVSCDYYGHLPGQIAQQLEALRSSLYTYIPHQALAQRNMLIMNTLGMQVMAEPSDQPGERTERVASPEEVLPPYAEQVIEGYQELNAPAHNNLRGQRFITPHDIDTNT